MACTTGPCLTPWVSICSRSPTNPSTSCASSTAATKISTPMARSMPSAAFSPAIWIDVQLLRHGHQLEHVPVRILKVQAAAAAPIVELAIVEAPGRAAEHDLGAFDTLENGLEFALADVEGKMMALKFLVGIEQ